MASQVRTAASHAYNRLLQEELEGGSLSLGESEAHGDTDAASVGADGDDGGCSDGDPGKHKVAVRQEDFLRALAEVRQPHPLPRILRL